MITEQNAFVSAIRANPDSRTVRLVYADWLDERDDPLGGYVRAEAELATLESGSPAWETMLEQLQNRCTTANRNFGGWEYSADLARLKGKIDQLRKLDTQMEVFGARYHTHGHEYRLNPPLRETDLIAFELRHGLTLPAEYRAFVLQVGNGPVGPDYGLDPLDLARDYGEIRKPFCITPDFAVKIAEAVKQAQTTRNWSNIPQPEDEEILYSGYLELCHHGCAHYSVLVFNGPLRGQMWYAESELIPNLQTPNFIAWYEEWLDRWLAPGAIEKWGSHFRR